MTRIAVAVDEEGVALCMGKAARFVVLSSEDGRTDDRTTRFDPEAHGESGDGGRGRRLARLFSDCDVVIAGSMGPGISAHLAEMGIEAVETGRTSVDEAVAEYLARPRAG